MTLLLLKRIVVWYLFPWLVVSGPAVLRIKGCTINIQQYKPGEQCKYALSPS